jgi:hypothetical protein
MLEFLAKSLLEASHVDIEAQNFSREWMLGGESFSAPHALLPGICSHRGIIGLRLAAGNCVGPDFHGCGILVRLHS